MYNEFINPNNGVCYAFIEAPAAMLQMDVPLGAPNSEVVLTEETVDAEGNIVTPATTRQKKVDEFIGLKHISLDGTKVIIGLTAKYGEFGRMKGVTEFDLNDWDSFLSPLGLGYSTGLWMGLDQSECTNKLSTLLNSEDYYYE